MTYAVTPVLYTTDAVYTQPLQTLFNNAFFSPLLSLTLKGHTVRLDTQRDPESLLEKTDYGHQSGGPIKAFERNNFPRPKEGCNRITFSQKMEENDTSILQVMGLLASGFSALSRPNADPVWYTPCYDAVLHTMAVNSLNRTPPAWSQALQAHLNIKSHLIITQTFMTIIPSRLKNLPVLADYLNNPPRNFTQKRPKADYLYDQLALPICCISQAKSAHEKITEHRQMVDDLQMLLNITHTEKNHATLNDNIIGGYIQTL